MALATKDISSGIRGWRSALRFSHRDGLSPTGIIRAIMSQAVGHGLNRTTLLLAAFALNGACATPPPPVITISINSQSDPLACQLAVIGLANPAALVAMENSVRTILPQCQRFAPSGADLLVELSVTRRNNAIEIAKPRARPNPPPDGRSKRRKKGIVFGLRLRAEQIGTHALVADVRAEQYVRRSLNANQEVALINALAAAVAAKRTGSPGS